MAPPETLAGELEEAGFARVEVTRAVRRRQMPREHALEMIRGRFASSHARRRV